MAPVHTHCWWPLVFGCPASPPQGMGWAYAKQAPCPMCRSTSGLEATAVKVVRHKAGALSTNAPRASAGLQWCSEDVSHWTGSGTEIRKL